MVKKLKDVKTGDTCYISNGVYNGLNFELATITNKTESTLEISIEDNVVFKFVGCSNEVELMGEYDEINRQGKRIVFCKERLVEIKNECMDYMRELTTGISNIDYILNLDSLHSKIMSFYVGNYTIIFSDMLSTLIEVYGEDIISKIDKFKLFEMMYSFYIDMNIDRSDFIKICKTNSIEKLMSND